MKPISLEIQRLHLLLTEDETREQLLQAFLGRRGFQRQELENLFPSFDDLRSNEVRTLVHSCFCEKDENGDQYPENIPETLTKTFDDFFCLNGMSIYAKDLFLEEYNALCREIHPYMPIAAKLSEMLYNESISIQNLERLSENILDIAVRHEHRKTYADNHCHIGGAGDINEALLDLTFQKESINPKTLPVEFQKSAKRGDLQRNEFIFRQLFRLLNRKAWDETSSAEHDIYQNVVKFASYGVKPHDTGLSPVKELKLYSQGYQQEKAGQLLSAFVAQAEKGYFDSAVLLYLTYVLYRMRNVKEDSIPCAFFLLLVNYFRKGMIMHKGRGLSEFVEYYNSGIRKKNRKHNHIRNIFMSGTTHFELKMSKLPSEVDFPVINREIAKTLHRYDSEDLILPISNAVLPDHWLALPEQQKLRFSVCYHFIKKWNRDKDYSGRKFLSYRYKEKYHLYAKETKKILRFVNSNANDLSIKSLYPAIRGDWELMQKYRMWRIDLRLLLRSLDAAGDENCIPPEVFAPYIRSLRNEHNLNSNRLNKRSRGFLLSFHAGEDFSHIVTGMRRVDETCSFLEYQSDDRLGHALAIGLSPSEWLKRKGNCSIPLGELFDNAVWLWHMANKILPMNSSAGVWIDFYAQKIRQYQKKLIPDADGFSPADFLDAWKLRRNHPQCIEGKFERELTPDYFSKNFSPITEKAKKIHEIYLIDGEYRRREKEKIDIRDEQFYPCLPNHQMEVVSSQETDFWEMVQDYQLRLLTEKRIMIEANPSSNIYIADINRYTDHPLFRWMPVAGESLKPGAEYNRFSLRRGPVAVCVNSDDPAIFSTSLQNEFQLLRSAAMKQNKLSCDQIDCWIERLRMNGVESFEQNYINPWRRSNTE